MNTARLKPTLIAFLAVTAMLPVLCCTGCAPNKADKILTEANAAVQTIRTCNAEMTMDFQYSLGSLETQPEADYTEFAGHVFSERTYLENPIKIKASATVTLNDQTTTEGYYVLQHDQTLRYYFFSNNEWSYFDRALSDSGQSQPDPKGNIAFVLAKATDFIRIDPEQQDGQEAYHYQAKLSGEALVSFLEGLGMTDNLSYSDTPEIKPQAFDLTATVAAFGSQDIDIWIDKNTNIPFRYALDLGPLAVKLLENALRQTPGAAEISCQVESFLVNVVYQNINNATDFEPPAELQNAKDLSTTVTS